MFEEQLLGYPVIKFSIPPRLRGENYATANTAVLFPYNRTEFVGWTMRPDYCTRPFLQMGHSSCRFALVQQ